MDQPLFSAKKQVKTSPAFWERECHKKDEGVISPLRTGSGTLRKTDYRNYQAVTF